MENSAYCKTKKKKTLFVDRENHCYKHWQQSAKPLRFTVYTHRCCDSIQCPYTIDLKTLSNPNYRIPWKHRKINYLVQTNLFTTVSKSIKWGRPTNSGLSGQFDMAIRQTSTGRPTASALLKSKGLNRRCIRFNYSHGRLIFSFIIVSVEHFLIFPE